MSQPRDLVVLDQAQFDQLLTKDEFNRRMDEIIEMIRPGAELSAMYLQQAQAAAAQAEREALGDSKIDEWPAKA